MDDPPIDWEMVEANLGLVGWKLNGRFKFLAGTVEEDDAYQDGVMGLARATQKFDPERGFQFSTYAHFWIDRFILRGVRTRRGQMSKKAGRDDVTLSLELPGSVGVADGGEQLTISHTLASSDSPIDERLTSEEWVRAVMALVTDDDLLLLENPTGWARRHGIGRQSAYNRRAELRERLLREIAA